MFVASLMVLLSQLNEMINVAYKLRTGGYNKERAPRASIITVSVRHAMGGYGAVPSQAIPQAPGFPQCVEWILENQQDNGSWGINNYDLSTKKCSLLSTLACIIALKKWNVGPEHIRRGKKMMIFLLFST